MSQPASTRPVARQLVVYLRRSGGQSQFSNVLAVITIVGAELGRGRGGRCMTCPIIRDGRD